MRQCDSVWPEETVASVLAQPPWPAADLRDADQGGVPERHTDSPWRTRADPRECLTAPPPHKLLTPALAHDRAPSEAIILAHSSFVGMAVARQDDGRIRIVLDPSNARRIWHAIAR